MAITATFGTAEYLDDDLIKIPITVDPAIVVLEVSDFKILDVVPIDSYIYGQGAGFGLYIIPKPETKGIMKVEAIGRVFASTAQSISDRQKVNSSIFAVAYNTITPTIIGKLVPSLILSGTQSVYLDLNIDVIGLNPQSFLVSGVDVGQPKLHAAPNPIIDLPDGSRPLPTEYVEYNNSDTPRRYFRLDFDFPDPPPLGNLNIDIKENSARGYLETYVSPSLPNMNLSFTLGLVFDQSYPITSSEIITGSITGLPDGISGSFSNNIIRINGTPTSTGSGNVSITITVDNISLTSTSPWTVVATAQQSAVPVPVLTMADSVLIKDEAFDVSGTISGNATKIYVEGLLRNWRYTYGSGIMHVLGDAKDVAKIENGIWDIIIKYITGATLLSTDFNWESLLFEYNLPIHSSNIFNRTPENKAIDFGSPSSGITNQNIEFNFIYRIPESVYTSIRVQFTGTDTSNTDVYFRCRTASTSPNASNITTHGTELFSALQQDNEGVITPATADETITNPDSGLYIWVYFETEAFITRRLTLSGVGQPGSTGQDAEITENANWRVVEAVPVITNPGTLNLFLNNEIRIPIVISNKPSVSIKGLLARLYYKATETGADLLGNPNRVIASSENRMITVDASTSAGSDQELFKLIVADGDPPDMSNVVPTGGNGEATFDWTAVSGASSYAYRVGTTGEWLDVGNVTRYTIEELENNQLHTIYWRVNSHWIGNPISVMVTPIGDLSQAMGVPGNMSIRFTWNAVDGAQSYAYRIGSFGNYIDVGNVTEYTVTGLTNDIEVTIYWRVNSPVLGEPISVTGTPARYVPARPDSVSFGISGGNLTVNWIAPEQGGSPIIRYDLERNGNILDAGNNLSYVIYGVQNGTYSFRVRAINSDGIGEWSYSNGISIS